MSGTAKRDASLGFLLGVLLASGVFRTGGGSSLCSALWSLGAVQFITPPTLATLHLNLPVRLRAWASLTLTLMRGTCVHSAAAVKARPEVFAPLINKVPRPEDINTPTAMERSEAITVTGRRAP